MILFAHREGLEVTEKREGIQEEEEEEAKSEKTSDRTGHHQIPVADVLGVGQWKVSPTDPTSLAYDDRIGCPQ